MSRHIITTFYGPGKQEVKINRGMYARTAVLRAIDHLQMDHYSANVVDIHDETTGELHAVLKSDFNGRISIVFKRDPKDPTCIVV